MFREQSRAKRMIATSRSDDNRDELRRSRRSNNCYVRPIYGNQQNNRRRGQSVTGAHQPRKKAEKNHFRLTHSFRNGHIDRRTQIARFFSVSDRRAQGRPVVTIRRPKNSSGGFLPVAFLSPIWYNQGDTPACPRVPAPGSGSPSGIRQRTLNDVSGIQCVASRRHPRAGSRRRFR
jgi:hypothetical protein